MHNSLIYFVQEGFEGAVKIGCTTNLPKRFDTLQTGNSQLLNILGTHPGTRAEERALHRIFASAHKRGEWYYPTADVIGYVRGRCSLPLDEFERKTNKYQSFFDWQFGLKCAINDLHHPLS